MSAINGKGYGYSHDWENRGTKQRYNFEDRATLYVCKKCNETFWHYYNVIPCIFTAMQEANIKEKCE